MATCLENVNKDYLIIIIIMMMMMMMMMSIPCRLRQDVQTESLGAGYNKSPWVPGLSFPSS